MFGSGHRTAVRGTTVDAARRYAERQRGTEAFDAFMAALAPDERPLLTRPIDRSGWYDVGHYAGMLDAAARHLAPGREEQFLSDGGAYVVDDGVNTLYRAFFAIASPQFVLRGSALLWRRFFRGSKLVLDASGRGFVRAHIRDASACTRSLCVSIRGGMVRSLEHGGARDVRVDSHRCRSEGGNRCEFAFSWR